MITTKKTLIQKLHKISEQKFKQASYIKELALSIERHQKEKTLKEWLKYLNVVLGLNDIGERRT